MSGKNKIQKEIMTIIYILTGGLFCSIIITAIKIRSAYKKDLTEVTELFEEIKKDN